MKTFLQAFIPVVISLIIAIIIAISCGFPPIGLESIYIFGFVLIFGLIPVIIIIETIKFKKK